MSKHMAWLASSLGYYAGLLRLLLASLLPVRKLAKDHGSIDACVSI